MGLSNQFCFNQAWTKRIFGNKHCKNSMKPKHKKVGLVLGGGGARGCAHVGVIKALTEAGIPIDCVAGTSIGALVGGVYVSGKIKQLEDFLMEMDVKQFLSHLDMAWSSKGLLSGEKVKALLKKHFIHRKIEQASIPFTAVATDLKRGREVHFSRGSMVDAIRASISVPGIFTPSELKGSYLADGGLLNPLPINVVRKMGADVVIAVDLNHDLTFRRPPRNTASSTFSSKVQDWLTQKMRLELVDILGNTITLMQKQLTEARIQTDPPDFLIRPRLGGVTLFDFYLAKHLIHEGYQRAKKMIPQILQLLSR